MKPLEHCRLYTFVDTAYLAGRDPVEVTRQLCGGGSDIIQLRAKNAPIEEVQRMAESIVKVTSEAGVNLVINDHLSVAESIGAEFCHLGQEDFFEAGSAHVSTLQNGESKARIGLSTHAPEQAKRALAAGAAYIAIGPVYATGTKPQAKPVTTEYVRWAAANVSIPWFAIGGITPHTVQEVLEAGARRICVVSAILNSSDIAGACARFRNALEQ